MNLTDAALFHDLTSIEYEGNVIDLHNCYYCTSVTFDKESRSLNIVFRQNNNVRLILGYIQATTR